MNIENKLNYFFETLLAEKNFSINSIEAYKRDLFQLFKKNMQVDLDKINEEYMVNNLEILRKLNTSNRS